MPRTRPRCPQCASTAVVPIVYGMPLEDDVVQAQAGRIVLGGCIVGLRQPDPTHFCTTCNGEFDRARGAYYAEGSSEAQYPLDDGVGG